MCCVPINPERMPSPPWRFISRRIRFVPDSRPRPETGRMSARPFRLCRSLIPAAGSSVTDGGPIGTHWNPDHVVAPLQRGYTVPRSVAVYRVSLRYLIRCGWSASFALVSRQMARENRGQTPGGQQAATVSSPDREQIFTGSIYGI